MFSRLALLGIAALVAACGSLSVQAGRSTSDDIAARTVATVGDMGSMRPPAFRGRATRLPAALRARMTSWSPGCPVSLDELRLLSVMYWGFDGRAHEGRLVANRYASRALLKAMAGLFAAHFPIERMRLVEVYGSDDGRSMAANNTSAFNCRQVTDGGPWSEHAYGRAIDINPVQNPEVRAGTVSPAAGARYLSRSVPARGVIRPGDVVVRAFRRIGWGWGGTWRSLKDYQHFSATGL
jgi:hypothetical protein